jgi:hypothetical protein
MNDVTMEAMRERIIGAVSPYVEIESPDLVEVGPEAAFEGLTSPSCRARRAAEAAATRARRPVVAAAFTTPERAVKAVAMVLRALAE